MSAVSKLTAAGGVVDAAHRLHKMEAACAPRLCATVRQRRLKLPICVAATVAALCARALGVRFPANLTPALFVADVKIDRAFERAYIDLGGTYPC